MDFILFIIIVFIAIKNNSAEKEQKRKLAELEHEIFKLKYQLKAKNLFDEAPVKQTVFNERIESGERFFEELDDEAQEESSYKAEVPTKSEEPPPIPNEIPKKPTAPKDKSWWSNLEEQFSTNLTGIMGTIAMIFGVIFLAVYAAIQLPPIGRFGMVVASSVLFYILHFFLIKKEFWQTIALWMRSASGVILMIGCLGSVGFTSMKWIDDTHLAIMILILGISFNLALGYYSKNQFFASLHVFTSFISLSIVPFNPILFYMATLIAMSGSLMSYRENVWDKNLIVTNLSFLLLNVLWFQNQSHQIEGYVSIPLCMGVALIGLASHYKKILAQNEDHFTSLATHILIWGSLGFNLYLHSKETLLSAVVLVLSSVATYLLSNKAKKNSVGWLFTTDKFISLILLILAVISTNKFGISYYDIGIFSTIMILVFLRIVSQNDHSSFNKDIFNLVNATSLVSYFILFILTVKNQTENITSNVYGSLSLLALSFIMLVLIYPQMEKTASSNKWGFSFGEKKFSTYIGIPFAFHSLFAFMLITSIKLPAAFLSLPIGMMLIVFYMRRKVLNFVFDISTLLASVVIFFIACSLLFKENSTLYFKEGLIILLISFSLIAIIFNWIEELKQKVVWPGVALSWTTLTIAAYYFTRENYTNLTGVLLLIISLLALGIKEWEFNRISGPRVHEQFKTFVTWSGLISIFLFTTRFFTIEIQSEQWIGQFKLRWAVELLYLAVVFFWWLDTRKFENNSTKSFCDYFLELFLMMSLIFSFYEMNAQYLGVLWIICSFAAILASSLVEDLKRLRHYSFLMFLFSVIHIGFVATTNSSPINYLFDVSWISSAAALMLAFIYIVVVLKNDIFRSDDNEDERSGFEHFLKTFQIKLLLYPLAISLAAFLTWTFSHSFLSLLLIGECFAFFIVSIVLREQEFRLVAMGGVAILFGRIIFYDLVGKDFFIKAIVFISVGAILVVMNIIYNKYKYRFEPAKVE